MNRLVDVAAWQQTVIAIVGNLGNTVLDFLPNLTGAMLILLVGWIIAYLAEKGGTLALRVVGLDRLAARVGLADSLDRAGIQLSVSAVLAKMLFWILLLTFLVMSTETLGVGTLTVVIDGILAYLPNLMAAALILLLGLLLARFVGSLVSSAAAATNYSKARSMGTLAKLLTGVLVIVVTLERLGIATSLLVGPLTAVVAAACFSAGLALAMGARPIITHILAGHFLKQSLPRESFVEVDGQRGIVARIGVTDTLLKNGEARWSVPNGYLLDRVIIR